MPRAAAAIRYTGKRGAVWRLKYADANGRQVMETLGREKDGWARQKAERELGKRLDLVERERWRKPPRETFGEFAAGSRTNTCLTATSSAQHSKTLSVKAINNHLTLLGLMFKVAQRWRLVTANPVTLIDRPRSEQAEIDVLPEPEIARLLVAYRELEAQPPEDTEAEWWALARRIATVALGTALRRGELLGLRWQDVPLVEKLLAVRQAYVRGEFGTPKSRASRRTIEIGPRVAAALEEQWEASR